MNDDTGVWVSEGSDSSQHGNFNDPSDYMFADRSSDKVRDDVCGCLNQLASSAHIRIGTDCSGLEAPIQALITLGIVIHMCLAVTMSHRSGPSSMLIFHMTSFTPTS